MKEIEKKKILHWMKFANEDLQMANDLMKSEFPIFRGVCFDCQQSVEKNLKAYMLYFNQEIVKTHDLAYLVQLLFPFDNNIEIYALKCKSLINYAVIQRYPDDFIDLTKEDAVDSIQIATEIEKYITQKVVL